MIGYFNGFIYNYVIFLIWQFLLTISIVSSFNRLLDVCSPFYVFYSVRLLNVFFFKKNIQIHRVRYQNWLSALYNSIYYYYKERSQLLGVFMCRFGSNLHKNKSELIKNNWFDSIRIYSFWQKIRTESNHSRTDWFDSDRIQKYQTLKYM